jgi:hypothetical protein
MAPRASGLDDGCRHGSGALRGRAAMNKTAITMTAVAAITLLAFYESQRQADAPQAATALPATAAVYVPPTEAEIRAAGMSCKALLRAHHNAPKDKVLSAEWTKRFAEDGALIESHHIWVNMNWDELECSWGLPESINKTTTARGIHQQLVYSSPYGKNRYVYMDDGIVTSFQE